MKALRSVTDSKNFVGGGIKVTILYLSLESQSYGRWRDQGYYTVFITRESELCTEDGPIL